MTLQDRTSSTPEMEYRRYERIMVTVRFSCGCEGIVSQFRTPETEKRSRYQSDDYHLCKNCQIKSDQAEERRPGTGVLPEIYIDHYMVEGHKMLVSCDKEGYWRGRCYEHGKSFRKYFGKVDPRPSLEEVLD